MTIDKLGLTESELDKLIGDCVLYAKGKAQDTVPIDTGNMRIASFKIEHLGNCEWRVYFNMEGKHVKDSMDGIAPYVKWTNERPVRTQGWFDDTTVERFVEEFSRSLSWMLMFRENSRVTELKLTEKKEEE